MPKGLERYYGRGHLHFLTFSCYRRLSLLNTARAHNVFIEALRKIHERYKFSLVQIPAAFQVADAPLARQSSAARGDASVLATARRARTRMWSCPITCICSSANPPKPRHP